MLCPLSSCSIVTLMHLSLLSLPLLSSHLSIFSFSALFISVSLLLSLLLCGVLCGVLCCVVLCCDVLCRCVLLYVVVLCVWLCVCLCVYIQNVSVCTGTTPTCVSTCTGGVFKRPHKDFQRATAHNDNNTHTHQQNHTHNTSHQHTATRHQQHTHTQTDRDLESVLSKSKNVRGPRGW